MSHNYIKLSMDLRKKQAIKEINRNFIIAMCVMACFSAFISFKFASFFEGYLAIILSICLFCVLMVLSYFLAIIHIAVYLFSQYSSRDSPFSMVGQHKV